MDIKASLNEVSRSADRFRWLLDAGHRLTRREAARRLGRHPRTISRIVRQLREHGVAVREEKHPLQARAKRYYLDAADQRRRLHLDRIDEDALLALTVAAEAARAVLAGSSLEEPLRRAFDVLLAGLASLDTAGELVTFEPEVAAVAWHFGALRTEAPDPGLFSTLRAAAAMERRVRIDYVNASGKRYFGRELSPLALAPIRGSWMLAAFCHRREAVRDFSLSRCTNPRLLERLGERPVGFDPRAHFGGRFSALEGAETVRVRVRVSPERAIYFKSRRYHPSQVVEERADGCLLVTYHAPGGSALDEVRAFIASWGPYVVALEPATLVERIRQDAAATAGLYTRSAGVSM